MCSKFLYSRAEYKNLMLQKIFERNQATHITQGKQKIILNTLHRTKNYIHRKKNLAVISAGELRLRTHHLFSFLSFSCIISYYIIMRDYFFFFTSCIIATCTFVIFLGSSVPVSRTSTFWYTFGEFIHFVLPASL